MKGEALNIASQVTYLPLRIFSSQTRNRSCTPLQWKHRILTTELPGKSQYDLI